MRRPIVGAELERLIASAPNAAIAADIRRDGAEEVDLEGALASLDRHIERRKTALDAKIAELQSERAKLR